MTGGRATWGEAQRRIELLERAIASPAPPASRAYERLLLLVNHERDRLDYEEREDSAATDGRLEPVEEPEPEPEPSAEDLQTDLESSLHFLEYLDGQRRINPGHDTGLADKLEHDTRLEIAKLRTQIAQREARPKGGGEA